MSQLDVQACKWKALVNWQKSAKVAIFWDLIYSMVIQKIMQYCEDQTPIWHFREGQNQSVKVGLRYSGSLLTCYPWKWTSNKLVCCLHFTLAANCFVFSFVSLVNSMKWLVVWFACCDCEIVECNKNICKSVTMSSVDNNLQTFGHESV